MRSELLAAALVAASATFFACGDADKDAEDTPMVGRPPQVFSAAYMWQGGAGADDVTILDQDGGTIQQFQMEPFAHRRTLPLALDAKRQTIVANAAGTYYVTFGESDYAVIKADGTAVKNPVELASSIKSVAFDAENDLFVISDEFQTMVFLWLTPDGDLQVDELGMPRTWKAGATFPDLNKAVLAGAMLPNARLALSLGQTTLAVVDVVQSILQHKWVYTSFEIADATSMGWIAAVPDQADRVMVLDGSRLLSVDLLGKAVTDERDLGDNAVRGEYRDYYPHVLTQDSSQAANDVTKVTYIGTDGKFIERELRGSNDRVAQTWLDPRTDTITIAVDTATSSAKSFDEDSELYRPHEIFRFQLTDALGVDRTTVTESTNLVVTPDYVLMLYKSTLGKAERRNYGKTSNEVRLEGYNLDLMRDRYRHEHD
jgi:hypothetical protein